MSNFPKEATPRAKTLAEVQEKEVRLEDYLKDAEIAWFYGAVQIFRITRSCVRSWFTAEFTREFNDQLHGDRSEVDQHIAYSCWKDLNTLLDLVIDTALWCDDKELFVIQLTTIVLQTIGPNSYPKADLISLRHRVHGWFDAMPSRWEDKADTCTSYDHGISFNYIDGLLSLLLDYHQDLEMGKPRG